jgi:hypothetical protein
MPDPLQWLGITKIHNFISMSDMKYNAIVSTGIKIVNRVEIPPDMVPVRDFVLRCLVALIVDFTMLVGPTRDCHVALKLTPVLSFARHLSSTGRCQGRDYCQSFPRLQRGRSLQEH